MATRHGGHVITIWLLGAAIVVASVSAYAQRPERFVPASPDTVLEHLPGGYAALEPQATTARTTPLDSARSLLNAAARTGDARLASRAEQLLDGIPKAKRTVDVLKAQAFAAQHRHDFKRANSLLTQALEIRPRDAEARLSLAQIRLVQGDLARARADCTTLILGVDSDAGSLCLAALTARQGRYAESSMLLDRWLTQTTNQPQALRYVLVARGEVASRMGAADADRWFVRALELDPTDVRTLAAYARHLRGRGRDGEVLRLLKNAPSTDALQLQRALAAHASGSPDANKLVEAQGRRYALAHVVGTTPELRDEAEFNLTLGDDAKTALILAQRNFATQRDIEDVDILIRAAQATNRLDVLSEVRAWARSQQIAQGAGVAR